jgi:glutamate racemase
MKGPIGIFDSGFGGLTVFRKILQLLPEYDYIYLGDNARTPYGHRSFETVFNFTQEGVDFLFKEGCPLIIIACNTASAKALRNIQTFYLPKNYPTSRVLGVIRPTVEAINNYTVTKEVALWGTKGTIQSGSFVTEMKKYAPDIFLYQQACPLLVPLIENNELSGPGIDHFIQKYLDETLAQSPKIDTLLLGCTHYPILKRQIQEMVGEEIKVVSQGELLAPSLKDYLNRHPEIDDRLLKEGTIKLLTTDQCDFFDSLGEIFMQEPITSERVSL